MIKIINGQRLYTYSEMLDEFEDKFILLRQPEEYRFTFTGYVYAIGDENDEDFFAIHQIDIENPDQNCNYFVKQAVKDTGECLGTY